MKTNLKAMYIRKVTTNGRICIPAPIRKKLKLKPGMRVYFDDKNGKIELKVKR